MSLAPNMDIERIEKAQQRETPADAVDNDPIALVEELIDHITKEKEVDKRPN